MGKEIYDASQPLAQSSSLASPGVKEDLREFMKHNKSEDL